MESSYDIIKTCRHEYNLINSKSKIIITLNKFVKLWSDTAFISTLILNLFLFLSFSNSFGDRLHDTKLFNREDISK